MSDPSGRVLSITYGRMMSPAVCGVCRRAGQNNGEVFADPQVYEEYIGNLYICEQCARAIIDIFGGISEAEATVLRDENIKLRNQNVLLLSSEARLENLVDNLSRDRLASRSSTTVDPSLLTINPPNEIDVAADETIKGSEPDAPKLNTVAGFADPTGLTNINAAEDNELDKILG